MNARRVPPWVWITLGVVGLHALFFWLVADRRFLPRVPRLPPPAAPANFGAATRPPHLDPRTGEVVTEREFTVSTRLAVPPTGPRASPADAP